jgi:hypothetical protein
MHRISEDLISSPSVVGGVKTRTLFRLFFLPTTNQATVKEVSSCSLKCKADILPACSYPLPSLPLFFKCSFIGEYLVQTVH